MNYAEYLKQCYQWIDSCNRIEFTWRDVFQGQASMGLTRFNRSMWHINKPYEPSVYIIRDSTDQPIYIGRSRRIIGRLKDHVGHGDWCCCGGSEKCITPVGQYIRLNSPDSHDWRISVLDLPECLEEATIWRYNPFYNDEHKPAEPSAVPVPSPVTPF